MCVSSPSPAPTLPLQSPNGCPCSDEAAWSVALGRRRFTSCSGSLATVPIALNDGSMRGGAALVRCPGETLRGHFNRNETSQTGLVALSSLSLSLAPWGRLATC